MINRRKLRVKALQALYSYYTSLESLKILSISEISNHFAFDSSKHIFLDKATLEEKKKKAVSLFNKHRRDTTDTNIGDVEEGVKKVVFEEIDSLRKEEESEKKRVKKQMYDDLDKLYRQYLKILAVPLLLEELHTTEHVDRGFVSDTLYVRWIDSKVLKETLKKQDINWKTDEVRLLKKWYRIEIIENEWYKNHPNPSDSLLVSMMRDVFFKSALINDFFGERDTYWTENKKTIQNLVVNTLKKTLNSENFSLLPLFLNPEEDKDFFETIVCQTMVNNSYYDDLMASNTQNWDIDRISLIDKIILKIALTEFTKCPSINPKVTINEMIEISKKYSSEKSKVFINGMLAVLMKKLEQEGKIRKTGRGLIDNR